ncbi:MAG: DUF2207 domain-containing protein [Tenericutes bacterium]|nr:DUF2207 domain-containing protein [Mycoplasmatota bacterium]
MSIEINDSNANQDNSVMWVNPILKTKLGKLLLVIGCIPMIAIIFLIDWKQIYSDNKTICLLQIFAFLISVVYVIVNYIISKINVYKIENKNKTLDYEYYREILDETSSGVLSFVYNKRIDYKDILISTLLKLEKEKIIKLDYNNSHIEILLNESNKLSEYEKYILNLLKSESKNEIIQFSTLKNIVTNGNFKINVIELVKKSSKEKGYYKTKNFTSNIIVYIILINFFVTILTLFSEPVVGALCLFNTIILFFLCYIANKKIYIRTKQGKLLSDKLNGLKKFLTENSIINERQIEEIFIWDYYIIYAIIFDLKGNLDRDVNTLYNTLR